MTAALLREVRKRHGVTQTQLAARAGTSQAAISRIERGLVSPSVGTVEHLLDVLGERLSLSSEPIDYGHDRTLIRANLQLSPEERVRRQAEWANEIRRLPRVR